jgi:chromosome segregation ATPase
MDALSPSGSISRQDDDHERRVQARVPATAAGQTSPALQARDRTAADRTDRDTAAEAWEREQLANRLHRLRRALPVLAQEMAAARRQVAQLRLDNRRLTEQVRTLRAQLEARN